jgi:hypothetical protein
MDGKNRNPVEKLVAGDIGATLKMRDTKTNDTLAEKGFNKSIEPIEFPHPRIRVAIKAKEKKDDEKLAEIIHEIQEEDPTILIEYSRELHQAILSAGGVEGGQVDPRQALAEDLRAGGGAVRGRGLWPRVQEEWRRGPRRRGARRGGGEGDRQRREEDDGKGEGRGGGRGSVGHRAGLLLSVSE